MEKQLLTNKKYILTAVEHNPDIIEHLTDEMYDDDQFMMSLINIASKLIKDNKYIILRTIKRYKNWVINNKSSTNYFTIICEITKIFLDDYDVILLIVVDHGICLSRISKRLKDNYDIVSVAVKQHGQSLCYASDRLKNNRDIVLMAIEEDSVSFFYTSTELKNDREFLLSFIMSNDDSWTIGEVYRYISDRLKNDRGLLITIINKYRDCHTFLNSTSLSLQNDRELQWLAYTVNPKAKGTLSSTMKYEFNI